MIEKYFDVAVDTPLFQTFTYKLITDPDEPLDYSGKLVRVPLRNQVADGIILSETQKPTGDFKIKEIHEVNTEAPNISPLYLQWLKWISDYYVYPLGQTLGLVFPPLKKEGGKTRKSSPIPNVEHKDFVTLTESQQAIAQSILDLNGFQTHLIYGITGSGKTEVYLEVLRKKIKEGKQALVLVPEISLTPQLLRRFTERFGDKMAVIHSQLTNREKTNQWWSIVDNKKQILMGARSALFCPFADLGVIIVDEEHDSSFKQDEKLKYNARDCAVMLGKILNIPVVLGSATPSLESWHNAQEKKYILHNLKNRISAGKMPEIEVVDMRIEDKRDEQSRAKALDLPKWLSEKLFKKIQERLNNREQVALFLNRRGLSQVIMCRDCGQTSGCPNCDVSLSLHARTHLVCHYCGYVENLEKVCKECGVGEPKPLGIGTEKVEEEMKILFPKARVIRLDRDEISSRESLEDAIQKIETGAVDILIGTQMIAKGLDFPKLTLVGILLADIGFNFPDFRTSERNFQLLTQVSGRPGRHTHNGEVVIQTYNPEYTPLISAQKNDYRGFAASELLHRQELLYPPFGKLASMRIQSNSQQKLKQYCVELGHVSHQIQKRFPKLLVLGPVPSPIFKLKNKYRYQMLLKADQSKVIRELYKFVISKLPPPQGVQLTMDIDPQNTF